MSETMRTRLGRLIATAAVVLLLGSGFGASEPASAQSSVTDAPPKHEFRASWIATVLRLDWPKAHTTQAQKDELTEMLDKLKAAGINAVFFQIRSECDAMYASQIEPWSFWLTGEQGSAPDPFFDPLEFAIEEAHRRGMELHAWFNPYRSVRGSGYPQSPDHISVTRPEWHLTFDNLKILNPGIPDVRDYVVSIFRDVVERYAVDGVHIDDFFYPYPPDHIDAAAHQGKDQETFDEFGSGFASIGEWRRANVDSLVKAIHEVVVAVRPDVVWGVSPFGIWKNGVPPGIAGLDAYNVIYADAVKWLDEQWIDYLTPQLYWAFGGSQDYAKLAPWWAEHAARNERHLYPGHGLYRSDRATFSGTLFAADEVPRQVRFNRDHPDVQGSVHFRAQNITQFHSRGFADSLKNDLYRYPALTPIMEWRDVEAPPAPEQLAFEWTGEDEVTLSWAPPSPAKSAAQARRFAVYRVRSDEMPDFADVTADARNLLAVTGETTFTDRPGIASDPYYYTVTSVSTNSIESARSNVVSLQGRATSIEVPTEPVLAFELHQNYPNPFRGATEIAFTVTEPASVALRVYNLLGQEVASLIEGEFLATGMHRVRWDGTDGVGSTLAPGTYFYALDVGGQRSAKAMMLLR